ncbi:MAG: [protein-PII] uridylyltransferase [Thermoguttaceae bacterium]
MSLLRSNVLAAKARLAKGNEDLKRRHQAGCFGVEVCALATNLRDAVLLELVDSALADLGEAGPNGLLDEIALVAHGGHGRRDVAPYSDVDLMVLHRRGAAARVARLAERLLRDVFDVGLVLGHSVRTPWQACRLARKDSSICTSLMESRLLCGSEPLFQGFLRRFRRQVSWRSGNLMATIVASRQQERARYGETVFLLEPNVKRSAGGLRELQLLRWIGWVRYGTPEPRQLHELGVLGEEDFAALRRAGEFLLWLRNELHFHAGQAADVLTRFEQVRIADALGYQPVAGLLPVEQFMREYFRHTSQVSHVVERFVAKATRAEWVARLSTALLGHRVEAGLRVGPAGITATRRGLQKLRGNLVEIVRLAELANLYDAPIAPATWEFIRREAPQLSGEPSPEACRWFLALLSHPGRLGTVLRDLHGAAILERFIPEFARARGLLQFNQYHKYTVDEHCLRAVEFAAGLAGDQGPLGRVYRGIAAKHVLHLALLIHDLGKGYLEDHREIGLKIAGEAARRLGLPAQEAERLKFLVHKHLRMNHLAFRRDTSEEETVVSFAVQVGSPEVLQMLLVLTAADLGAVGPDVWDGWKAEILIDLYHRTMQQLAGESPATTFDELYQQRRAEIRKSLGAAADDPWFLRHVEALPSGYLNATSSPQVAADLRLLHGMGPGAVLTDAHYLPETATVLFTIGTSEQITSGIFHKLTGALTSHGLEIRTAQIHTLADGLVLDRFWVHDPDFAAEPPPDRLAAIKQSLVQSLLDPAARRPAFRRTWLSGSRRVLSGVGPQTQVNTDNSTSSRFTIIDVITLDRTGLLYAITRTLFEMELSVWRAKIGTFLDQVVDVFYVTDGQDRKVEEAEKLEEIRRRLIEVIDVAEEGGGRKAEGGREDEG